jgi:aquaporin Z
MPKTLMHECAAEFVGTYLLILTVGCNVLGGNATWAALSIAAILMVSIYSLGTVSGANFNPAVTFALFLTKAVDGTKMVAYMVTQVIAGILAGVTYTFVYGASIDLGPSLIPEGVPGYDGKSRFSWMCVAAVEILYTFMLCFVVLRVATSKSFPKQSEYFGLAIGFVIVAGGFAAGGVSGGAFNPAVAIGLDVSSAGQGMEWCLGYALFEFIGAGIAAFAHMLVEDDKIVSSEGGRQFISEFLGTYYLVLTVGLNVLLGGPCGALSIAAALMCMIYALGDVSGAHFNPAVTVAIVLTGKAPASIIPAYFAAQLSGGLCGALSYVSITGLSASLGPAQGSWYDTAVAEIMYTFVLCFVVLNVACQGTSSVYAKGGKATQMYGLAIGFCIVVGGFAIGPISGGSLNPAVSLAIDTSHSIHGGKRWLNCVAYSAFEVVGASIAAGLYYVVRDGMKEGLLPINKKEKNYGAI